jgi:hypothetical protein
MKNVRHIKHENFTNINVYGTQQKKPSYRLNGTHGITTSLKIFATRFPETSMLQPPQSLCQILCTDSLYYA